MVKVYACLVGNWVCLNDDPECVIGVNRVPPDIWWKENADVYAPLSRDPERENSLYGSDHVELHFRGKDYRINPIHIQIVTE